MFEKENKIDFKSSEIIKFFNTYPKASYRDAAKELGVSPGTIHNRLNYIEEEGIFKRAFFVIDFENMNYITCMFKISVNSYFERRYLKDLSACIICIYETVGDCDVVLVGKFKNLKQLNCFKEELFKNIWINEIDTDLSINIVRESVCADNMDWAVEE